MDLKDHVVSHLWFAIHPPLLKMFEFSYQGILCAFWLLLLTRCIGDWTPLYSTVNYMVKQTWLLHEPSWVTNAYSGNIPSEKFISLIMWRYLQYYYLQLWSTIQCVVSSWSSELWLFSFSYYIDLDVMYTTSPYWVFTFIIFMWVDY